MARDPDGQEGEGAEDRESGLTSGTDWGAYGKTFTLLVRFLECKGRVGRLELEEELEERVSDELRSISEEERG